MAKPATIEGRTELISLRPGNVLHIAGIAIRAKKTLLFEVTAPDTVKIEVVPEKRTVTRN